MTAKDHEFDWVRAYANCSVKNTFNELALRLNYDVDAFNSLDENNYTCYFKRPAPGMVVVSCGRPHQETSVVFKMGKHCIQIFSCDREGNETLLFTVQPIIVNQICKLKNRASKEVLDTWQVSDMALSPLLFPEES